MQPSEDALVGKGTVRLEGVSRVPALRSRLLKGRLPFIILVAWPCNDSVPGTERRQPDTHRPVSKTNLQKAAFANEF